MKKATLICLLHDMIEEQTELRNALQAEGKLGDDVNVYDDTMDEDGYGGDPMLLERFSFHLDRVPNEYGGGVKISFITKRKR